MSFQGREHRDCTGCSCCKSQGKTCSPHFCKMLSLAEYHLLNLKNSKAVAQ